VDPRKIPPQPVNPEKVNEAIQQTFGKLRRGGGEASANDGLGYADFVARQVFADYVSVLDESYPPVYKSDDQSGDGISTGQEAASKFVAVRPVPRCWLAIPSEPANKLNLGLNYQGFAVFEQQIGGERRFMGLLVRFSDSGNEDYRIFNVRLTDLDIRDLKKVAGPTTLDSAECTAFLRSTRRATTVVSQAATTP
jgi:hypothetical protein